MAQHSTKSWRNAQTHHAIEEEKQIVTRNEKEEEEKERKKLTAVMIPIQLESHSFV